MPQPSLPDVSAAYDTVLLLPALLTLLLLLGEHGFAARFSGGVPAWAFPLVTGARWLWPLALVIWIVREHPLAKERLALYPPESPLDWLSAVGTAAVILIVVLLFWKWTQPYVRGSALPFWLGPHLPRYARLLLLCGEAFAHQTAFAGVRSLALTSGAAWAVVLIVAGFLVVVGLPLWREGEGLMPQHIALTLVGLFVGTGLVLDGHSLWIAIAWEWLFLVGAAS